jgi:hypothetical protein
MRIARLFDGRDANGDWAFAPDRRRITDPDEQTNIAHFLRSGAMIVRISGLDADRLDPTQGDAVPMNSFTDGSWIWSDGLRYYLEKYGIAPEPEFLAHMAACDYLPDQPDQPARRAAIEQLRTRR